MQEVTDRDKLEKTRVMKGIRSNHPEAKRSEQSLRKV